MAPSSNQNQFSADADQRAKEIKKLHERVRARIEKQNSKYKTQRSTIMLTKLNYRDPIECRLHSMLQIFPLTSMRKMLDSRTKLLSHVPNNKFSGSLPASLFENFQGMKDFSDSAHHLPGSSYMSSSYIIAYNDSIVVLFEGQFRELVRILTTFTTIDLSNNMFDGEIPHVIGELSSLIGLNLSHNKIGGIIPQTLGNLTSLEWLDISWNQLEGEIPVSLTNLNFLAVLNLSQNHLEGMIPTGKQFNTFQNDSYVRYQSN
ncbi:hypothetical protein PIB30_102104 [Stylosanthes scabra]|uniref:Uncharacterized protein n=1 Tax=Stylosanthes scabra TaxID=79078 RepID=A0ABU6QYD1_9FABA|nr:hypothetical protein [Stylosanthes scabra]